MLSVFRTFHTLFLFIFVINTGNLIYSNLGNYLMRRLHQISISINSPSLQSTLNTAREILYRGIYSIEAINKSVNKRILSMFYSPGVGACCMAIKDQPETADSLTLRGRSIAIISDGSVLESEGKKFMPIMDWIIAQIKFYSGLDCFPFVIRKGSNLQTILQDISTCYGTVLYLDLNLEKKARKIPTDLLILQQVKVSKITNCQITDAQKTAYALAYLLNRGSKGLAQEEDIKAGLDYKHILINKKSDYDQYLNTGNLNDQSIKIHDHYKGKIQISLSAYNIPQLKRIFTLSTLKQLIKSDSPSKTKNLCAIVTDGTAILGFGDIGPKAGLPVMEGKSLLFRLLGEVEVVPVCIKKRDSPQKTIQAILDLLYFYQAINLEDFKAPQCFEIQAKLSSMNIMPVFHDDQHGTAIVVLAGFINALKLAKKDKFTSQIKVVLNGAGAAGITIAKILHGYGVKNIVVCDRSGAIHEKRKENMNAAKKEVAKITNPNEEVGKLQEVIKNADAFIGVSTKGALKKEWVKFMKKNPIIFALANPDPEITQKDAKQVGCFIYGSGRSDYANQINNSLVFPGVFKGITKHKIKKITDQMKIQSAIQIANIAAQDMDTEHIIPDSLNKDVALKISEGLGKYEV